MARSAWDFARLGLIVAVLAIIGVFAPLIAVGAPYAAYVMDARTGEVLHARNADTPLHPASLTKMMTLYIAFQAIERGEVSLDSMVTITSEAANEPPSKLGLRSGQQIRLRYLIRAAAVKSANDAATAIGIFLSGSESAFARRMTQTALAMGMNNTSFRNANGLTQNGHYSTAHDMSILGRHLIYDFPQYYNLFSRRSADAGIAEVANTNRRFLDAYEGADGIKTGYTSAAGYNLTASAQRGNVRIIATVFGGTSTSNRNAQVAELLDMGFDRAPANARLRPPTPPGYVAPSEAPGNDLVAGGSAATPSGAGKIVRVSGLVSTSPRPHSRPGPDPVLAVVDTDLIDQTVADAVADAVGAAVASTVPETEAIDQVIAEVGDAAEAEAPPLAAAVIAPPESRPTEVVMVAAVAPDLPPVPAPATVAEPEIVSRISTSGGRLWGINVGRFNTRYEAERILLQVALAEMTTLEGGLRRVEQRSGGFDANVMGLTRETADLACRRLQARGTTCFMIGAQG